MFDSPATAAAVLDRLLHHAHVITLKGESYRMRSRLAPPKTNGTPPEAAAAPAVTVCPSFFRPLPCPPLESRPGRRFGRCLSHDRTHLS